MLLQAAADLEELGPCGAILAVGVKLPLHRKSRQTRPSRAPPPDVGAAARSADVDPVRTCHENLCIQQQTSRGGGSISDPSSTLQFRTVQRIAVALLSAIALGGGDHPSIGGRLAVYAK